MTRYLQSWPGLALLWLSLCLLGLFIRPLFPVDETRYIAVAWEMWHRGDFLVPYLNGEPYSHKPPLFFWLIHAGWSVFGVNEWWPRLVGPLSTLAVLYLTALLARRLWPDDMRSAEFAPWVLFSSVFFTTFFTWVQIDMLLAASVLLALVGVLDASHGKRCGWLIAGLGMGLGLLIKGPVVLLHVLPVMLLAPAWLEKKPLSGWAGWYGGIVVSAMLAAAIVLAWVIPAVQAGGADYQQAILWSQTVDRVTSSFAHANPVWWYLPWLLVLLLPWYLFPGFWRQCAHPVNGVRGKDFRFLLSWMLPVFVLLCLISGKQAKYLLPLLPAFALLVSRVMAADHSIVWRKGLAWLLIIAGGLLAGLPLLPNLAGWLQQVSSIWGLMISAAGLFVLVRPIPVSCSPAAFVGWLNGFVVAMVLLGFFGGAAPAYDMEKVSALIARAQEEGRPVVNLGDYHGQFHFAGRLQQPVATVGRDAALAWTARRPDGYIVTYPTRKWLQKYGHSELVEADAVHSQPYRGAALVVWEGRQLADYPQILMK